MTHRRDSEFQSAPSIMLEIHLFLQCNLEKHVVNLKPRTVPDDASFIHVACIIGYLHRLECIRRGRKYRKTETYFSHLADHMYM